MKVVMPDGATGNVLPNADGSYTATLPGTAAKGKWADEGTKTCFVGDGETKKHCATYPGSLKVGDVITDDDGAKLTIVAGR